MQDAEEMVDGLKVRKYMVICGVLTSDSIRRQKPESSPFDIYS